MRIPTTLLRLASGLYNQADVQKMCNVNAYTWRHHLDSGAISKPTHPSPFGGGFLYYNAADAKKIKKHFDEVPTIAESLGLISIRKAAQLCGIPGKRLYDDDSLPKPTHRHGARYYYKPEDLKTLKKAWQNKPSCRPSNPRWKEAKAKGFLSGIDAAKLLGMPHITFSVWLAKGQLPKPTRKFAGLKSPLYNQTDLERMRNLLASNGYKPRRRA